MKLIVKDYLSQLKEKDELDFLICDILLQMGYTTKNRPRTGNRQFGVDIRADNRREILLCVIKQGNLNRSNWDSGQNAIRQSLNEIKDCYLNHISERNKVIHVAVISNGMIEEAVLPNWEGYVSHNTNWNGFKVKIEFWNIDDLTTLVCKHLFNEHLFGEKMQSLFRRALYFIDESNYRREYYEQVIDNLLSMLDENDTRKKQKKILTLVHLASQMIAQYAAEKQLFKVAISVSEYLIIKYWKYLFENQLFNKTALTEWVSTFLLDYERWNDKYYGSIKYYCEGENRIPAYHPIEQRIKLYEIVGYLTSYAYYLHCKCMCFKKYERKLYRVYNSIISLINNYPQFNYAPYDVHIAITSMLYRLMTSLGESESASNLLKTQTLISISNYKLNKHYPTPIDSFEDAINIYEGYDPVEYNTSVFWGVTLEWIVSMDKEDLYNELLLFLSKYLSNVTVCTWFLKSSEEKMLYDPQAMHLSGEGVAYTLEKTFDKFENQVKFIRSQYSNEVFSYDEYSFEALEFIISRYYGYLVRIKNENSK